MRKIKVASLFASLKIGGGVERVQANLSVALSQLGYNFYHILMDDKNPRCEYEGKIINLNIPFVTGFGIKKIGLLWILAKRTAKISKENNIDILIGQGDFFFMVSILSKIFGNKAKIISVVHTSIGAWSRIVNFLMRQFLYQSDHIVLISQKEEKTFIKKYNFPEEKLSLIYNAIDSGRILTQSQEILEDIYLPLFTSHKKTFINVARLNYQKNQALLIESFSQLKDRDTQLIIIGQGDERKNLEALIEKLNLTQRVHLLGNQINPHKFVSRADYCILTSRFEGYPVSLLEAGILGKPIISLDCPTGPREFLDPNGKIIMLQDFIVADNGIIVKYGTEKENMNHLQEAMQYVLTHDNSEISNQVSSYCKQFDISQYGQKRDKLITSLS